MLLSTHPNLFWAVGRNKVPSVASESRQQKFLHTYPPHTATPYSSREKNTRAQEPCCRRRRRSPHGCGSPQPFFRRICHRQTSPPALHRHQGLFRL
jgi:hypothetical protein